MDLWYLLSLVDPAQLIELQDMNGRFIIAGERVEIRDALKNKYFTYQVYGIKAAETDYDGVLIIKVH